MGRDKGRDKWEGQGEGQGGGTRGRDKGRDKGRMCEWRPGVTLVDSPHNTVTQKHMAVDSEAHLKAVACLMSSS